MRVLISRRTPINDGDVYGVATLTFGRDTLKFPGRGGEVLKDSILDKAWISEILDKKKGATIARNPLELLVAGTGFEPVTFWL
jgi:hypothetical protein